MNAGSLFRAVDLVESGHTVFVKMSTLENPCRSLAQEEAILNELHGIQGVPDITWSGTESEQPIIMFEDLGSTLEDVFNAMGRRLCERTVSLLAEQLVRKPSFYCSPF